MIEPFFADPGSMFIHGITFGGHPVSCAIALANLEIMEREDMIGHVQRMTPEFRDASSTGSPRSIRWSATCAATARSTRFELVKDKETKATFTPAERDVLIKQFFVPRARELGVYMRVDDRAETAAQFSPPLVAGRAELDEFMGVFRQVLDEAYDRFVVSPSVTMTRTLQNFVGGRLGRRDRRRRAHGRLPGDRRDAGRGAERESARTSRRATARRARCAARAGPRSRSSTAPR